MPFEIQRRTLLQAAAIGLGAFSLKSLDILAAEEHPGQKPRPTNFQIACMTLPYGQYPLVRALAGEAAGGQAGAAPQQQQPRRPMDHQAPKPNRAQRRREAQQN